MRTAVCLRAALVLRRRHPFCSPHDGKIGSILEVAHTYALFEGSYGILNEKQLAFGESTCGATLRAAPVGSKWACRSEAEGAVCDGEALLDIAALSRIALERCATARCAIETMGALAEEHGYYRCVRGSAKEVNDPHARHPRG